MLKVAFLPPIADIISPLKLMLYYIQTVYKEGIMATHDEETRSFFKSSSVQVLLCPRIAGKRHSWVKQRVRVNLICFFPPYVSPYNRIIRTLSHTIYSQINFYYLQRNDSKYITFPWDFLLMS